MDEKQLKIWRENFIKYMMNQYGTTELTAMFEYHAYVESIGIDNLDDDHTVAVDECVDGWKSCL